VNAYKVQLIVSEGDAGEVLGFDGSQLTFLSSKAFAPGQPIQFAIIGEDLVMDLNGKSQGSKRRADEFFEVRIKVINLRRTDREWLLGLFQ